MVTRSQACKMLSELHTSLPESVQQYAHLFQPSFTRMVTSPTLIPDRNAEAHRESQPTTLLGLLFDLMPATAHPQALLPVLAWHSHTFSLRSSVAKGGLRPNKRSTAAGAMAAIGWRCLPGANWNG
jgi:hypothetical protein